MTGQIDHFVFATLMTLFTVGVGGLVMVIIWVKILIEPPTEVAAKYSLALYSFTASVCLGIVGLMVALTLTGNTKDTIWNFSLLISFACVTACAILGRNVSGPGIRALWKTSVALFLFDLIGFIGMIMALPGMPLNNGR